MSNLHDLKIATIEAFRKGIATDLSQYQELMDAKQYHSALVVVARASDTIATLRNATQGLCNRAVDAFLRDLDRIQPGGHEKGE